MQEIANLKSDHTGFNKMVHLQQEMTKREYIKCA